MKSWGSFLNVQVGRADAFAQSEREDKASARFGRDDRFLAALHEGGSENSESESHRVAGG